MSDFFSAEGCPILKQVYIKNVKGKIEFLIFNKISDSF